MKNKGLFTYGSVCSGIESATVAWGDFATPLWFSEIDAYPCAVLKHHYPDVPNLYDMTKIKDLILSGDIEAPDVLVGGTPCQAFSVAGLRGSLDDERGKLSLAFVELANVIDQVREQNGKEPCIIVWENVTGVLNTKDNAFGCFIGAMSRYGEELLPPTQGKWGSVGYICGRREIAWKVFNSKYYGVPQNRRRVYLIASARKGAAAEIHFNEKVGTECVTEISQTRKERSKIIRDLLDEHFECDRYRSSHEFDRVWGASSVFCPVLMAAMGTGGGNVPLINTKDGFVRKLTPIECERLQGFPDNYTLVPFNKGEASNSVRYKALGNSMTVNVMRHIGENIKAVICK